MFSSKSYIQYFIAVLLLSLYSIQEVSSMACYSCDSDLDRDCIYNPAQQKFGVICSPNVVNTNNSNLLNSKINDSIETTAAVEYNCASAIGISTKDAHFRVVRGCAIKPVTCSTYQIIYAVNYDLQLDKCLRCNTDFCNYVNN